MRLIAARVMLMHLLHASTERRRPSWGLQWPALKGDGKRKKRIQACVVEVEEQGQAECSGEASPRLQPAPEQKKVCPLLGNQCAGNRRS